MSNQYAAVYDRIYRRLPVISMEDEEEYARRSQLRRNALAVAVSRVEKLKEAPDLRALTARVPKSFWIPSRHKFISVQQYLAIYNWCKDNPGQPVQYTLSCWWGGTTDDLLREIRKGIHERIYLRQFIKPTAHETVQN